jgi:hypothetical protein
MRTFGLAFCVREYSPRNFALSFGYAYSQGRDGFIRRPRTWIFDWPIVGAHVFQKFGASQVQGLLGGVEDLAQRARSDALERAIGDVLTVLACEILDSRDDDSGSVIYILGPALHKSVGRMASLRPPENVIISWICPIPFPSWISRHANEPVLIPSYHPPTDILWEEEPLIVTSEIPGAGEGVGPCVLQELRLWSSREGVSTKTLGGVNLWNTRLPREIVVAAGHVEIQTDTPYDLPLTSSIQPLQKEWVMFNHLYAEIQPRKEVQPGWAVEWSE